MLDKRLQESIDKLKQAYEKGLNIEGIESYLKHSLVEYTGKEFKRLDFEGDKMPAKIPVGDKMLTVATTLSVDKYKEYEILNNTFAFGKNLKAIHNDLTLAIDFMNKMQFVKGAVVLSNLEQGFVRMLEDRIPSALELCFLFMTYDDEDVTHYHPELNAQKLKDISAEGYAMEDFFTLACNLSVGYIEVYQKISQTISQEVQAITDIIDK